MRRIHLVLVPLFIVALLGAASPALAHGRHWVGWHYGMSYGPWWGWGWGPYAYAGGPAYAVAPPDLAVVDTDVEPEHARVYLNGELIGTADDFDGFPDYLYLERGRYELEFRVSGYESGKIEIEARPGRFFPVDLKLKRIPGQVEAPWYDRPEGLPVSRVFGPPRAGRPEKVVARPDTELREELRGRDDDEEREDAGAEERDSERAEPVAKTMQRGAALDLRVTPENASVYLDGAFLGTAEELGALERGASVGPGKHRIDVVAPGYQQRSLEVEVRAGERRQIVVELEGD